MTQSSNQHNNVIASIQQASFFINNKHLVKEVSFEIHKEDVISLIGPNGAGKSTLVKLILGLLIPTSGAISKQKGLIVGYVPQKFSLPSILPLTVKDLLAQCRKNRLTQDEKYIIFDSLSLNKLLTSQVSSLSGGELQRVLLGKALLDKPDLLVLDEPMQGLDPEAQTLLYGLIDSLPPFLRCAMLVVSHDLHWVMKGTKRVICLNKHICCSGVPSVIAKDTAFIELFGNYSSHELELPYSHRHTHCHHT